MCNKAVDNYSIQFVPKRFMTQEMCGKAFNKFFLAFFYIPDQYKTQEMCNSIISEDPFLIRYVPD